MSTSVQQRRIVVTGAAGFIGSHVVARLVREGADVVAVVHTGSDDWRLHALAPSTPRVPIDVTSPDFEALVAKIGAFDGFVHLAAAGVNAHGAREDVIGVNVTGSARALAAAARAGAQRFIYCGSCFEYAAGSRWREESPPQPETLYGASKFAGWVVARALATELGVPVVALRPFTVYGPFEGAHRLVPRVVMGALRDEAIQLTGGAQSRDWVYIDDVAEAFVRALCEDGVAGHAFNVCTGTETSVRAVTEVVLELTGTANRPAFGALPYREHEFWQLSGDPARAAEQLRWRARTGLREGIIKTITWFRDHAETFDAYRRCALK